jgi:large subunit ribosomal protein L3
MKANVPPKGKLTECRVTPDCFLPLGYELSAKHFIVGQKIDAKGITIGKGF